MRVSPSSTSSMTRRSTGRASRDQVEKIAGEQGIKVARQRRHRHARPRTSAPWRRRSRAPEPTPFFFGGITQNKGVQLFKDVSAAIPDTKLFGPDGVADSPFFEKIGAPSRSRRYITAPTAGPEGVPAGGAGLLQGVQGEVRQGPGARTRSTATRPWASRSTRSRAPATTATTARPSWTQLFKTKDRESVLGTYEHRRERRHHAVRLRRKPHRGRQARLRQGHQGPDVRLAIRFCNVPPAVFAGGT